MTNDELRMTNQTAMPNDEWRRQLPFNPQSAIRNPQ